MERTEIPNIIEVFRKTSGWNRVPPEKALRSDIAGMEMFSPALVGISSAEDPAFLLLKREGVVGPQFLLPREWLPGARSVVSFFLPFTARVREANAESGLEPAQEWL
ncbi:MAG: hypothetical protein PHI81_02115, partial [Synergistaceae bacterium]|nr:hypothetical protein [Synergistaceae bacterium]